MSKIKISEVQSLKKSLESVYLIDLYTQAWTKDFRTKALEKYPTIGEIDEEIYKSWPEDPMATFIPGKEYLVQIPCKLIQSCDTYNRTLEISFDKCVANLEYSGGFKLNSEIIRVYYDRKNNGIVRVTRGNHRTIMDLLAQGADVNICAKLIPHDVTASDVDMLLIEADDFDEDNQFLGMTKTMKFKGQLLHDIKSPNDNAWAIDLYEFLDSCNPKIGIAQTNSEAKVELDGFGVVKNLMVKYNDNSFLKDILETQAKYSTTTGGSSTYLSATLTKALASFKSNFMKEIDRVSEVNNIDAWDEYLDYVFNKRNTILPIVPNLTQADLVKGNSLVRIPEFHVATLATLFNEFVKVRQLNHHDGKKDAISVGTKSWQKMLKDNVSPLFHAFVNQKLTSFLPQQA